MNLFRRQEEQREGRFKLKHALTQVERIVRTKARKDGIALDVDTQGEGEIQGEQRLAVQAIVNLATNAVKACQRDRGRVEISILDPTTETVGVRVSDNGPGIPREARAHLFRPYSAGVGSEDGHGLGLFIVRQTVRKLGGRIRIQTSEEGTTFDLEFPRVIGEPTGLLP
jgi:signal transduction histidine kinase